MARSYEASDYAGIESENLSAYYGYEELTAESEWCFVVRIHGEEVFRLPSSRLSEKDKFNCAACLLAGLAAFFDKFKASKEWAGDSN